VIIIGVINVVKMILIIAVTLGVNLGVIHVVIINVVMMIIVAENKILNSV